MNSIGIFGKLQTLSGNYGHFACWSFTSFPEKVMVKFGKYQFVTSNLNQINLYGTKDDICRLRKTRRTTNVVFSHGRVNQALSQKREVLRQNAFDFRKDREILIPKRFYFPCWLSNFLSTNRCKMANFCKEVSLWYFEAPMSFGLL